jgi:hypothetical protein
LKTVQHRNKFLVRIRVEIRFLMLNTLVTDVQRRDEVSWYRENSNASKASSKEQL